MSYQTCHVRYSRCLTMYGAGSHIFLICPVLKYLVIFLIKLNSIVLHHTNASSLLCD